MEQGACGIYSCLLHYWCLLNFLSKCKVSLVLSDIYFLLIEADKNKDSKSTDRCLNRLLYLVVQRKLGNNSKNNEWLRFCSK